MSVSLCSHVRRHHADELILYPASGASRTSYVYEGIHCYAASVGLTVKARYPWQPKSQRGLMLRYRSTKSDREGLGDIVLATYIDRRRQLELHLVFDISDFSTTYNAELLSWCDVYFKRSYLQSTVPDMSTEFADKIRPLGLPFGFRAQSDHGVIQRVMARIFLAALSDRKLPRSQDILPSLRELWGYYCNDVDVHDIEVPADVSLESAVLFQTRLWENTSDPLQASLNAARIELAQALKTAFGTQFRGGVIGSTLQCSGANLYPNLPSRRPQFMRASSTALIGVSTIGLHGSTPWKIPEYMAQSKVILSEPLKSETPVPLKPGIHYLPFTSMQEALQLCREVLADAALAARLRTAAWTYYVDHVRPHAWFAERLQVATDGRLSTSNYA